MQMIFKPDRRRRRRTILRRSVLAVAILSSTVQVFSAAPASASSQCRPGFLHQFAGILVSPGVDTVWRAKANISFQNTQMCTTRSSDVDGTHGVLWFTMVAGRGENQYAQIGFARIQNMTAAKLFTEYNDGTRVDGQTGATTASWRRQFFNSSLTLNYQYDMRVYRNCCFPNGGQFSMASGSSVFEATPFRPEDKWIAPFQGQFLGENWDTGDDMPGRPDDHAEFRGVQIGTDRVYDTYRPFTPEERTIVQDGTGNYASLISTGFDIWSDSSDIPLIDP